MFPVLYAFKTGLKTVVLAVVIVAAIALPGGIILSGTLFKLFPSLRPPWFNAALDLLTSRLSRVWNSLITYAKH